MVDKVEPMFCMEVVCNLSGLFDPLQVTHPALSASNETVFMICRGVSEKRERKIAPLAQTQRALNGVSVGQGGENMHLMASAQSSYSFPAHPSLRTLRGMAGYCRYKNFHSGVLEFLFTCTKIVFRERSVARTA